MHHLLPIIILSFLQIAGIHDDEITLAFVGDAMQHTPQITAATRSDGSLDYSQCFSLIQEDIETADYAVANLEVPLGGKPYSGYPVFSAPDEFAEQLHRSGFDLLLTANNHCLDRGSRGVRRTIYALRKIGIPSIGTYASAAGRDSVMPYIANVKGRQVAILNYTYGTNGMPIRDGIAVDLINRETMRRDIALARNHGAQIICVCIHWGEEYHRTPGSDQLSLADFLVDEGADIIIGSHPHVIQPFELRHSPRLGRDVAIAYSLGNFISNQNDIDCRGGAMAIVKVKFSNGQVSKINIDYKLLFCQKPDRQKNGKDNYKLIPVSMRDSVRTDQLQAFDKFLQRTRTLLSRHNSTAVTELQ